MGFSSSGGSDYKCVGSSPSPIAVGFFLNISPFYYFIPELSFSMSISSLYALLNVDSLVPLVRYFLGPLSHLVFLYHLSFTASLSSPAQDCTSDLWCFVYGCFPGWFVIGVVDYSSLSALKLGLGWSL